MEHPFNLPSHLFSLKEKNNISEMAIYVNPVNIW